MSGAPRHGPGEGTSAGPQLVLINGQPEGNGPSGTLPGCLSTLDRGLHFGDGLFETIACRRGRPRFLSLHLERLAASCERIRIAGLEFGSVRREIEAAAAGAEASLIKLIVTRGPAVARGYGWSGAESATRVLLRYSWPQENAAVGRAGVRVRIAAMRLGQNAVLAGMKHLNRLEQVLARSEVPIADAAELLLFSSSGHLVSGTMSNVFIVRNGQPVTPRLDQCGVAGVMRRVVLREAAKAGLAAEERVLSASDLEAADEIFLTNARIGIWPVSAVDTRTLPVGATTRRLQELIAPLLESAVDA